MSEEVTPSETTATPASDVPTDFREYVRWREAGGETANEPAATAGDQPPDAETAPAPEPEQQPQQTEESAPEEETESTPAKRPGAKERKIEWQAREIELLKAQLAALQPKPPEAQPAKPPVPPGKPKLEDFETLEAYQEALTDWKLDQREAAKAVQSAEAQLQTAWSSSEKTARAAHADYDEIVQSVRAPEGPGVPAARQAMLEDGAGAEILYHLATHPDELKRIAALPPIAAVMAIGKLSAALAPSPAGNGKPKAAALPKPPPALSRPAKTSTENLNDENFARNDYKAWERLRWKQLKG